MVSNMTHVCLGDVAREIKQKVPAGQELPTVGLEHLDPGEVELAHWDEGVRTTFTKAFSKGQVLFGRRRAYLRKAAVAPFDGICLRRHHPSSPPKDNPLSETAPVHHPE